MAKRPKKGTPEADEADRVKKWTDRLVQANAVFDKWQLRFECQRLERYRNGEQWRGLTEEEAKTKYVVNLIFSTIEEQEPSLLFYRPKVKVEPGPHASSTDSDAAGRAELIEDTLQTFIDDRTFHFTEETGLALDDVWFYYSLVEVGYTADYLENPNAGKPLLKEKASDDEPDEAVTDGDGNPVLQPTKVLSRENLYLKRIPPEHARVSLSGKNILTQNDWFAYYEWFYLEDVKRDPQYENTKDLKASGRADPGTPQDFPRTGDDPNKYANMVKIWKIWDLRQNVRHVIADGYDQFLQEDRPFSYFPIAALKFFERRNEFYPLPPIYNWLSPQDEYNESREMQRNHRRRFVRKYTTKRGSFSDQSELDKLQLGGDGTIVVAESDIPIVPVPDADLSSQNWAHLKVTKDDFREVSGVGGDQRGIPEAETATQANIINVQSQIRESKARVQVADWLSNICRLMLLCLRENMQLPFWVQRNVDPLSMDQPSAARVKQEWQEIESKDLGSLDVDVHIDVASLSPVSEESQRAAWFQVLQILKDPTMLAIMQPDANTPNEPSPLLRKTLGMLGIKSDKEVRQISAKVTQVLQQINMALMAQAAAKPGSPMHPMVAGAAPPAAISGPNPGTPTTGPTLQ